MVASTPVSRSTVLRVSQLLHSCRAALCADAPVHCEGRQFIPAQPTYEVQVCPPQTDLHMAQAPIRQSPLRAVQMHLPGTGRHWHPIWNDPELQDPQSMHPQTLPAPQG
jgi:hypothetical protein